MVANPVYSELPKHICYRRSVPLIKVACYQHSIFLARPLHELWTHIRYNKSPSFAVIVRTIKVLALGIFQGHLCDYMLLACYEGFCHSIGKKKLRKIFTCLKGVILTS